MINLESIGCYWLLFLLFRGCPETGCPETGCPETLYFLVPKGQVYQFESEVINFATTACHFWKVMHQLSVKAK